MYRPAHAENPKFVNPKAPGLRFIMQLYKQGDKDIIQLFLDHGAGIKASNSSRRRVLQELLTNHDDGAARFFSQQGTPTNHKDNEGDAKAAHRKRSGA